MTNIFSREERSLKAIENLRNDLKNKNDNILTSLSLFVRLFFMDSDSKKFNQFNKYDLIASISVDLDFPKLYWLNSYIECCRNVKSVSGQNTKIDIKNFFSTVIIIYKNENFTVSDFLKSIAYNGTIHNEPENEKYQALYDNFVLMHKDICLNLIWEISECLLNPIDEIIQQSSWGNDIYAPDVSRALKIIENGKIIAKNMLLFSNNYMQNLITGCSGFGIRIVLKLKLILNAETIIFSYGNRFSNEINLECYVKKNIILIKARSEFKKLKRNLKIKVKPEYFQREFLLEIAVYPSGEFIASIDNFLKSKNSVGQFEIVNGKFVLGSSLDGKEISKFYLSECSIETIDANFQTDNIFRSAMYKLPKYESKIIPPNQLKR